MNRIEIVMRLKLPSGSIEKEACKAAVKDYIKGSSLFENFIYTTTEHDNEATLSFDFDKIVCLDQLLETITHFGAELITQFIQLPSSFSGIVDAYDARDYGEGICSVLGELEGVSYVHVSSTGNLRVQCETRQMDDLLDKVKKSLLHFKNRLS